MITNFEIPEERFKVDFFIETIKKDLKEYEFSTFNLGISYPYDVLEEEKILLKKEFQYHLVKEIEAKMQKKRTEASFGDIDIIIDFNYKRIEYKVSGVYVYGVYTKHSRELPQTIDFCYKCRGRGCSFCSHKGVLRDYSIQEIIEKYFKEKYSFSTFKFHGAGREDIDVLMLGNGREFVVEMEMPKTRNITEKDLKEIEDKINVDEKERLQISSLKVCIKEKVAEIKNEKNFKAYKAVVSTEEEITSEDLKKITLEKEIKIKQFTPKRVEKRRALLTRERIAEVLEIEKIDDKTFNLKLKAESGLYVKEFISGEGEKTKPSISEIIGKECRCTQLDVVWIYRE
jgi:tRNA pseudouridine synthase 10